MTQLNRDGKKGSKQWDIRRSGDSERQKRQKETENAESSVLDGLSATDARADASSPADAPSVSKPHQASAEKTREEEQNAPTDASDAPIPTSSKWAGMDL